MTAEACPSCHAEFDEGAAWRPLNYIGEKLPNAHNDQMGSWSLLNLAIGATFLISAWQSPGQRLLKLVVDQPTLSLMTVAERGLVSAIFGYWLVAAIAFTLLRLVPQRNRIAPTSGESFMLTLANAVLIAYVVARVYASTIEGGGAGFAVASLSVFTALPALILAGVIFVKIAVRAFKRKERVDRGPRATLKKSTNPPSRALMEV